MTSADWAILVPAIAAFLTATAAYLRAHTTAKAVRQLQSGQEGKP